MKIAMRLIAQQARRVLGTTGKNAAVVAAFVAVGALLLAACGSSSPHAGASDSASSASTTVSKKATGKPIVVGMICDCSGADGSLISEPKGYQALVDSVNASGGINGHPIKFLLEDTDSNPGTAVSDYQTLVSDHVVAIVDDSNFDTGFASSAESAKIPVVGSLASSTPMFENPDFYPSAQTEDSATYAVVATAKAAGAKNIGVLYCSESPVCQQLVPLVKTEGKQLGVPSVFSAAVAETAPSYTALCVAAQQAHVSTLAVFTTGNVLSNVAKDCAQQGYDPTYLSEGQGMSPSLLSAGVQKLYSEYEVSPYWSTNPAIKAMDAAVNKYEPGVLSNTNLWNQEGVEGWAAGMLLEAAVKAGGLSASQTPTSAEIVKGLEALHGTTLGGLTPPLSYPAGKAHPEDCWFTGNDLSNKPSLTNNGKTTCE